MFKGLLAKLPSFGAIFNKNTAVKVLAVTGVAGLGYHLLNPRPSEPVLPAEIPPTPEQLGAQAAVNDFVSQMEAMPPVMRSQAAMASPQINTAGLQHLGMVGSPELAMGAGR